MIARAIHTSATGLVYSDRGHGPTIVLLHGWCLNRKLWIYQEEALIADHRVICPDLAGFGDSADLSGPYTIDRYAADLAAFLNEVTDSEVVVVGFAFGAAVAMAAVAGHGVRPRGLVMIGVPSAATAPYDRMPRAMRRDWPAFAHRSALAICKQPHSEEEFAWLTQMFAATSLPVALETVALLGRFEPVPLASRIDVPTLLVHGGDDDVVPVSVSEGCAKLMPNARVEIVPQSGHLVILDQKERFDQLLRSMTKKSDHSGAAPPPAH